MIRSITRRALELSTQFGSPQQATLVNRSVDYYFAPQVPTPRSCYAMPQPMVDNSTHSEWVSGRGYKPINLGLSSSNFPTTGADGFFFDLSVVGITEQDVINNYGGSPVTISGIGSTNVKIKLAVANTHKLQVTLVGPKDGDSSISSHNPTTFKIYSDGISAGNLLYSFTISKWFIADLELQSVEAQMPTAPSYDHNEALAYCATTLGSGNNYRLPNTSDYTNATSIGTNEQYQRQINGSLFSEWGFVASWSYPASDFKNTSYWTQNSYTGPDPLKTGMKLDVNSGGGVIGVNPINSKFAAACVSH